MYFSAEQARTQCNTAKELLLKQFKPRIGKKILDSVFFLRIGIERWALPDYHMKRRYAGVY